MGRTPSRARSRALALGVLAAGALLATAGPAAAATLSISGSTLVYTAAPGEKNKVGISLQAAPGGGPSGLRVSDSGNGDALDGTVSVSNSAPTRCAGGGHDFLCQADGISSIRVELGDLNDDVGFTAIALPVTVLAGDGADNVNGSDKSSVLDGGAGTDAVTGGGEGDTITGGDGADTLRGGDGADVVDGGEGKDTLFGESGGDALHGGPRADALDGGAGADTLDGGTDGDDLKGGSGTDIVSYADRTTAVGVDMNDNADDGVLNENDNVQSDVEVIVGGAGNDRLAGRDCGTTPAEGSSTTTGGGGSAAIQAAPPACDDVLEGGPGDDTLFGRGGDDTFDGGDGADQLDGGQGADTFGGGDGQDSVTYGGRTAAVNVTLDGAADDGEAGEGDNVIGTVEDVYGGAGDDTLVGNEVRNLIGGQGGNDTIAGGGDDDVLNGGEGADTIRGGDGKDIVNYSWEEQAVSVSYDGDANDGAEGEHDNLAKDIEGVIAGPDGDALLGGAGDDFLYGYGGADNVFGGPGADLIVAGDSDDYIQTMDGAPDFVSCGDGEDVALVDPTDNTAADCETKVVGTAVQVTTPGASVRAIRGTVTVPVTCQAQLLDACAGTVRLTAKVRPAVKKAQATRKRRTKKKRKAVPKPKTVVLGSASYEAAPGATTQVTIPLSPAGAKALARLVKLSTKATATSTDRAGGVSTATQTFVLTGPKPKRRPRG